MKKILPIIAAMLILLATSCTKLDLADMDPMGYQLSLAVPICQYQASILKILEQQNDSNGFIQYGADGKTIYITWEGNLKPDSIDVIDFASGSTYNDVVRLNDIPAFGTITTPTTIPTGKVCHRDTVIYEFDFDEVTDSKEYYIDSMSFNGASVRLHLETSDIEGLNGSNYLVIHYSFPGLRRCSKKSFADTIRSTVTDITHTIPACVADFTEVEGAKNGIRMTLQFDFVSNGNLTISQTSQINYEVQFVDIQYNEAYGSLMNADAVHEEIYGLKVPQDIYEMDIFQENTLLFHDPRFEIKIRNNLGVDLRYTIDYICSVDHSGNRHYGDFNGQMGMTQRLSRPDDLHQFSEDLITLNRSYGSTYRLFEEIPDSIYVKYRVFIGNGSGRHNDFLVYSPEITVDMKAYTDMCFDPATNFTRNDTVEADLASADTSFLDYAQIDTFFIYLTAHNHIPVQLSMDLAFLDSLGNELYLVNDIDIDCPEVNPDGTVKETTNQRVTPILFLNDTIHLIMRTKSIRFTAVLKGKDAESLTNIKATDNLSVEVSAFAKAKANLNKLFDN